MGLLYGRDLTSGKSNLTKKPHCRRMWMVFPILYNGLPLSFLPLKIAPSCGGSGFPPNTWYLGTTWVHNPNSISICSAILQDSRSCRQTQTNRETAHTTPSVITVLQCGPKRETQFVCGVLWCIKLINISRFTNVCSPTLTAEGQADFCDY